MVQVLIPDMEATTEINPALESLRTQAEIARVAAVNKKITPEVLAKHESAVSLEEKESPVRGHPRIIIGYLTGAQITKMRASLASAFKDVEKDEDDMDRMISIYREITYQAVRGWKVKTRSGKDLPFDPTKAVDTIERMDWLFAVGAAVINYNNLDGETEKK